MEGYLSSRKDQISLDVTVEADLEKETYSLRGYDTLLGRERFFLFYENRRWHYKQESKIITVEDSENLGGILPAPALFDYGAFFRGAVPQLKNARRVSGSENSEEEVFESGAYVQKNQYGEDRRLKSVTLFYHNEKIYQFTYEDLLAAGDKIFPKILNIYDYTEKRKIVWWLSKITAMPK